MKFTSPRGTRDILPKESIIFRAIQNDLIEVFHSYGYSEIITPIFESTDLFQRAVGETTDIVEKEMYTFIDKGNRSITLRPEGTASVVRAFLQNIAVFQKHQLVKLFYTGPMFRYERPQTGRYRQFYQIGVEAIGSSYPLVDVESIMMAQDGLLSIGIDDAVVAINSVGCDVCRPVIREQLKEFVASILPNLCDDCKSRYEKNPLRILDCKNPVCQDYFTGLPSMTSALCKECNDHFVAVIDHLEQNGIQYSVDPNLVRGLDYYTKTVFEIRSSYLGAQNAVCGGGRYDNLVAELGGRKTPAFGFAMGLDRLSLVLESKTHNYHQPCKLDIYVIGVGQKPSEKAFLILDKCRKMGFKCDYYFKDKGINDGLKQALNLGAGFVLIIGEEEFSENFITLKDLRNKKQYKINKIEELKNYIK